MIAHFARMFRYVAWADRRTLAALRKTPAAHADALPLFAHLMAAGHVWLSRLEGRDARFPIWPTLALDECDALLAENDASYRAFVAHLDDELLAQAVHYRNAAGAEGTSSVADILTQVLLHGPYHRGQIAKIVGRAGGGPVPSTDFITWVREGEPG